MNLERSKAFDARATRDSCDILYHFSTRISVLPLGRCQHQMIGDDIGIGVCHDLGAFELGMFGS